MSAVLTHSIIDTAQAREMMLANAIRGAAIIGAPGGWSVLLKLGKTDKTLGAQRTNKPRQWISLDRCVKYLKQELGVARFDLLDATEHGAATAGERVRSDASDRLRRAHAAAQHDEWFRKQVQESLDDPSAAVSHESVKRSFAAKRAALRKRSNAAAKATS